MSITRKNVPYTSLLLTLLFCVIFSKSLQFNEDRKNLVVAIQKYFPHESNLCVIQAVSDREAFLLPFHVPVVVFTQYQVLHDCGRKLKAQGGYVIMTSNAVNLGEQIVPLLQCINRTTLKLKTKYILVLDLSKDILSNPYKDYSNFFHNLWHLFGTINIGILPVQSQILNTDPFVFLYNPFLTPNYPSLTALKMNTLNQDVRGIMIDRFHNMHGHPLKTVFFRDPNNVYSLKDGKTNLGVDSGTLFKQMMEATLNASFDVYELSNELIFGLENDTGTGLVGELSSGRADYCISVLLLLPGVMWLKHVQLILSGISLNLIFVVPKPRKIESWQLFQYIFQWKVCAGLGIVLFSLSIAAVLFVHVHSETNMFSQNSSGTSEVVSVWKAVHSVPIIRLPTTHSQRLLLALSFVLGLIFVTLFSVQLFALIKSKPRLAPIKTLQDLHDANLPIYTIYKQFSPYLNSFENTTLHRLKDNLKTDKMYENVYYLDPTYLNITDRALVYTDSIINLVMSIPQNKAFLQSFEVVKEPIYQAMLVMYMPIGSVYYEYFNKVNLRLTAGGFNLKWYQANRQCIVERYTASSTPSVPVGSLHKDNHHHEPLTYDDLKMAFYLLYTGLTVSAVCFLKEVCNL